MKTNIHLHTSFPAPLLTAHQSLITNHYSLFSNLSSLISNFIYTTIMTSTSPFWVADLPSPFGPVTIAVTTHGVAWVALTPAADLNFPLNPAPTPDLLGEAVRQFSEYFDRTRTVFDLPVDWSEVPPAIEAARRAVMSIPYGETRTYGQVAQMAGIPNGARVVGHAMATNPCLILIPCHRVLLANGKLGHFSAPGGAQTRANLLTFEGYYLAL